ncbi:MAG: hypothetical protein Q7J27_05205 [Syntrophales bacterium]|nr:hypothetical protein [Syntrophales bacterium]
MIGNFDSRRPGNATKRFFVGFVSTNSIRNNSELHISMFDCKFQNNIFKEGYSFIIPFFNTDLTDHPSPIIVEGLEELAKIINP